ncbi:hypothetical protein ACRAVF_18980 [Bradyrhizobium oligotrophicum S58]
MIKKISLFSMFERALKNDPNGSRKSQFDAFFDEVQANPAAVEQLAKDYFDRNYAQWEITQSRSGSTGLAATAKAQETALRRQEAAAETRQLAQETVSRIVNTIKKIVMLDLIMPNGKKLRECTFAEVARFGGMFTDIGKEGKPTQVIDKHLSEADLQSIRARWMLKNNK